MKLTQIFTSAHQEAKRKQEGARSALDNPQCITYDDEEKLLEHEASSLYGVTGTIR
jgi:hypothetical protein